MDAVSIGRLQQLHPAIRKDAIAAYNKSVQATPKNVHPVIIQTLRTFEEQELLYEKGRSRPGQIVTNAKPGQGYHNYGLAIDFCLQVDGKLIWHVTKDWMTVVNIFKSYGFSWGGDWKSLKDYPHLEKNIGHHWSELLALHNSGKIDEQGYVILPKIAA